jgi:hypothetical protein
LLDREHRLFDIVKREFAAWPSGATGTLLCKRSQRGITLVKTNPEGGGEERITLVKTKPTGPEGRIVLVKNEANEEAGQGML